MKVVLQLSPLALTVWIQYRVSFCILEFRTKWNGALLFCVLKDFQMNDWATFVSYLLLYKCMIKKQND